jgi:cell wall-associated NlpC family hydrolase
MKPFYDGGLSTIKLLSRASAWKGASFELRACVPFSHVDCINLALDIYRHSSFNPAISIPQEYRADWGVSEVQELIEEQVKTSGDFEEVKQLQGFAEIERAKCFNNLSSVNCYPFKPGDLILIKTKGVAHHVGVMTGFVHFIHSVKRHGVYTSHVQERAFKIRSVWRPITR